MSATSENFPKIGYGLLVRSRKKFSSLLILIFSIILSPIIPLQGAVADDSPPLTGLYISSSYEHLPAFQGNTNVYLEWTLWLERSYWDTHEIHNVECTSTRGNCLSKGHYSPARIPPQGQIRVDSLSDELPVDITLSVVTKLTSNPTETSTYTITHTYRSPSPDFSYVVSPQRVSERMVQIEITSPLVVDARQYKTWFSCASASGATCVVSGSYSSELTTWIGQVQLSNYIQGQDVEVIINRHWATASTSFAVDGIYGSTVKKLTIPTLGLGITPEIGAVTSESDGCSFNIVNFNPLFQYYFKRTDADVSVSDSGTVRLRGQSPGTTVTDYPSSRRTGYTSINNTNQKFNCTSLISEAMKSAQAAAERDAAARAAAEAAAAQREAEKKSARSEIVDKFSNSETVSIKTFTQAEIAGITEENIEAVQAEIAALPGELRADITQILKVAYKYEVVGIMGSERVKAIYSNSLVEIGLISNESKHKATLTRVVKELSQDERSSYVGIKEAIEAEIVEIQKKKDRLANILSQIASRRNG